MKKRFIAKVKIFKRENGWYYVLVPTNLSKPLEIFADRKLIAVMAKVGKTSWPTSLLPMGDGTHFIALPLKVRVNENISLGTEIEVSFKLRIRASKY